jgi:predicted amidophosphoribosyltransferase
MSLSQRRRSVGGAFKVADPSLLKGRTVVLIDDVITTGSTADACARALLRAGAGQVQMIGWARVVRPSQLMR